MKKKYLVASRHHTMPPKDWLERLKKISGLELVSSSQIRASIIASTEAIEEANAEFGGALIFEEVIPRNLQ